MAKPLSQSTTERRHAATRSPTPATAKEGNKEVLLGRLRGKICRGFRTQGLSSLLLVDISHGALKILLQLQSSLMCR